MADNIFSIFKSNPNTEVINETYPEIAKKDNRDNIKMGRFYRK